MTNNQTKCGIIYEKIAKRVEDDERTVNYERPYLLEHTRDRPRNDILGLLHMVETCEEAKRIQTITIARTLKYIEL